MSQFPPNPPLQPNYQIPTGGRTSGFAITALILGIVSIFPGCCLTKYGMLILGVLALVFAVLARGQIARGERRGSGMALAGMITAIIGIVLGLFFLILSFAAPSLQQRLMNWQKQLQQQQQQRQTAPPSTNPSDSATASADQTVGALSGKFVADWRMGCDADGTEQNFTQSATSHSSVVV
jgi:predicted PurR-regulated permease PerM